VAGGAPKGAVYLRKTDGSPAVRLGEGHPVALSPDGKRVLVAGEDGREWTLLPTGPGLSKRLPIGPITRASVGRWLDDRRIVFGGYEPGRAVRAFVQDVEDGSVRPVTPEGTEPVWTAAAAAPGGRHVLAFSGEQIQLYPTDGGDPHNLPFPTLASPAAWSADGRALYVTDPGDQPVLNVYRQDVASGRRQLWKTLSLSDPAGIESIGPVVITPDGSSYCYTYTRTLGTLHVVEGLR